MIVQALREIQKAHGYLPRAELVSLSERTKIPLYRLNEVASFFPHFRTTPPPAVQVHVCRDMSCHLAGAAAVIEDLKGLEQKEPPEASVAVHGVSCLGRCDRAVAVCVEHVERGGSGHEERYYCRRSAPQLREVVQLTLAGRPPAPDFDAGHPAPDWQKWDIDPYKGGPPAYEGVKKWVANPDGKKLMAELKAGDLRGMGGAGVPADRKWTDVAQARGQEKFVVVNGDESEPGTFKDRELLLRTPHVVLEGLILAGLYTGATRGYIYIRHEYEEQIKACKRAIAKAEAMGVCGDNVLGTGRKLPIEVFVSPGGYICGEMSALIEAMEDRRAEPRPKPPSLETNGYQDKPTLVSNVETFGWVPYIWLKGGQGYADLGVNGFKGKRFFSISGDVTRPGVYEVPGGTTFGELIHGEHFAQGMRGRRPMKAFAPSGPSGGFLPAQLPTDSIPADIKDRIAAYNPTFAQSFDAGGEFVDFLDLPIDLQALRDMGIMLGAGVVAYGQDADMVSQAVNGLEFYRNESCGKCVPCRVGSQKLVEIGTNLVQQRYDPSQWPIMANVVRELGRTMEMTAICGLGAVAANPLTTTIRYFVPEVRRYLPQRAPLPMAGR